MYPHDMQYSTDAPLVTSYAVRQGTGGPPEQTDERRPAHKVRLRGGGHFLGPCERIGRQPGAEPCSTHTYEALSPAPQMPLQLSIRTALLVVKVSFSRAFPFKPQRLKGCLAL